MPTEDEVAPTSGASGAGPATATPASPPPRAAGPPPTDAASALAALLDDPVVVVDVGCRWGFADIWDGLGDRALSVGFDPDTEECARLASMYAGNPHVRVVPSALGAAPGPATLYRTADPAGWSVLPTVDDVVARHPGLAGGKVEGTSTIELTTLDEWCAAEGITGVDVIKIDTQGSELAVLTGAATALEGVRAVEAEVEFNELYVDVPLFGDIDRFLRQRGFVLWRLRNLAHYAQAGARRDWKAEESWWVDEDLARFRSPGGQLFWANAFYLRRPTAYPDAGAGWQSLVRDACINSSLGFLDLVGLALEAARETAPPEVLEVLDAAASRHALAERRRVERSERATVLDTEVTVDMGAPGFEGTGWLPVQRLAFGAVRWTGPAREASIDLPYRLAPGTTVELLAIGAMSDRILETLAVEVNRSPLELSRTPHAHGVVYRGTLPAGYTSPRRWTRLVVRTVETIPWNELHPESPEDAELGVAVSWVRLTPCG